MIIKKESIFKDNIETLGRMMCAYCENDLKINFVSDIEKDIYSISISIPNLDDLLNIVINIKSDHFLLKKNVEKNEEFIDFFKSIINTYDSGKETNVLTLLENNKLKSISFPNSNTVIITMI